MAFKVRRTGRNMVAWEQPTSRPRTPKRLRRMRNGMVLSEGLKRRALPTKGR
jgi:hypothetical protein